MKFTPLILGIIFCFAVEGHAARSTQEQALKARSLIEMTDKDFRFQKGRSHKRVVLPVSRGFSQNGTGLCWAYSLLNMIETRFYFLNPSEQPELSRRFIQYFKWQQRYLTYIDSGHFIDSEFGTALDGSYLISDAGLISFGDYLDTKDPYGENRIKDAIDQASGSEGKVYAMSAGLRSVFGLPPDLTHFFGRLVPKSDFKKMMTMDQVWVAYAPSLSGPFGLRQHPDPDANPGTLAYYVPYDEIAGIVKRALEDGYPVEFTLAGHSMMIYGAEFDERGMASIYYVKDSVVKNSSESNENFFYPAYPTPWLENIIEITTAK